MEEPVILSEAIITQANSWAAACWREWDKAPVMIGQESLTSPVNGEVREVALVLGYGFRSKGFTVQGVYTLTGEQVRRDGYTVAINRNMVDPLSGDLLRVILHELIHAVDPVFDADMLRDDLSELSNLEKYALPSEIRAFAGMWICQLKNDLANGTYQNPGASLQRYKDASMEFKSFCDYGSEANPGLNDVVRHHFGMIVEELRRKMENPS